MVSRATKLSAHGSSPAFVLDSSIALAWCFPDEEPHASSFLDLLETHTALIPPLWYLEVANALLVGERRKRCTAADTARWMSHLRSLPLNMDEHSHLHAWDETLALARSHTLSVYDASYLELALRRGIPLATLDRHLASGAKQAGVQLYRSMRG